MQKRKRVSTFSIVVFSLCLFIIPAITGAKGDTYYVRSDGNDESSGTSWDTANKTIQRAINTAINGDIIIVGSSGTGHGTGVYTENVNVTKSLIIRSENGYATTTVHGSVTSDHVFEVQADSVTIGGEGCGFSIYGATNDEMAGIYLSGRTACTIQGNRCGWDSNHKNHLGINLLSSSGGNNISGNLCDKNTYGISLAFSSGNTISGNTVRLNTYGIFLVYSETNTILYNTCVSNTSDGICLYSSNDNLITGNTNTSNTSSGIYIEASNNNELTSNTTNTNFSGIFLKQSSHNMLMSNTANSNTNHGIYFTESSNNTLIDNTTNLNGTDGIWLYSSSNHNMLTKNSANLNTYYGIYLDHSDYNILTNNTANSNSSYSNSYGIYISFSNNNAIYLNNFNNTNNVFSQSSNNTWNSPTPIFYNYTGGSYHKNYLGNYYSDYAETDDDGDGIGNSAYTEGGTTDNYPLMATADHYSLQAWWLSGDSKMYRADMTKSPGVVAITGGSSQIWSAEEATLTNISFSGTDGWTGQVIFTSPIANNDSFKIEIGYSSNGSDFNTGGPNATIIRDGSDSVFTYQTNASAFTVPEGNYLALKITNNSSNSYSLQTGGASSYCSAPNQSQDYSLPVELASFNATAGNGNITLKWITESEIENLGFNIYRSTSRDGEFVMLNAKLIAGAGSSSESHEYSYIDRDVKSGLTYWYKLEDVDYNGKTEFHGPISAVLANTTPTEFGLHKNYPNPFNPVTTISYDLAKDVYVELAVYNILGGKVITLVNGNQPAGSYQLEWDGRDSRGLIVSSGMYLLRINAGNYCKTNKMVFVR